MFETTVSRSGQTFKPCHLLEYSLIYIIIAITVGIVLGRLIYVSVSEVITVFADY